MTAATARPLMRPDANVARADAEMDHYRDPVASPFVMGLTRFAIRHFGLRGIPVLRILARFFPTLGFLRGMRIVDTDLPPRDLARLKGAVRKDTAAFLSPNHPEFFTDIVLDWHVGSIASKRLAFWAAWDVANLGGLRHLWARHNLISNAKGGRGRAYSRECALRGDGVLLHPEGDVGWTSDVVQPGFPGIATLPLDTAREARRRGDARPVYVVPLAWKLEFTGDVSDGLHYEMGVLERRLGLASGEGMDVGPRFFALVRNVLRHREEAYGFASGPIDDSEYFARQERFIESLLGGWEERLGISGPRLPVHERILRLRHASRALRDDDPVGYAEAKRDYFELRRARHTSQRIYNRPRLTQENMAETLKRFRQDLVKETTIELLRTWMPFAVGDRVLHVRVAEPIDVAARLGEADADEAAFITSLRDEVHDATQGLLDEVNRERYAAFDRFAVDNPFYRRDLPMTGAPYLERE